MTTHCRWCHSPGEPQGRDGDSVLYRCIWCGMRWVVTVTTQASGPRTPDLRYVLPPNVALARAIDAPRRRR